MGLQVLALAVLGVSTLTTVPVEARFPFLSGDAKWSNLKVTYDFPFRPGRFGIPLSTKKIGKEYKLVKDHEEFPKVHLYAYKDDPRLQPMYDDHGNICGLRVAYIKDHIEDRNPKGETFPYTFDDKPVYKQGSALGKKFYYIDVLFIHPDVLKTGGPASRAEAVGTGVYINMDGKTWTEMPRNEVDTAHTKFTKQACFYGMGQHYFYNMNKQMRCEDHQPVFLMYLDGKLIGLGLIPFGTFDPKFGRPWFEDPPKKIIKRIVPTAPDCLSDWVDKYGTISLHIYFRSFNHLNCVL